MTERIFEDHDFHVQPLADTEYDTCTFIGADLSSE
jgi:hypothetical protein